MLNNALQNPGVKYTINAQVRQLGSQEQSANQKRFQRVTLFDGKDTHKVKIWQGNNPPIVMTELNNWLSFDITGYTYMGKTYLSGFWNSNAQVNQAPILSSLRCTSSLYS